MKNSVQILLILCFAVIGRLAIAAVPDPVDPRESVNYTFEQRMAQTKQLHAKLKEASPADRLVYFEKSIESIKKLTPEERHTLREQFRKQWKDLSDAQKKEIKEENRSFIKSLPEEERKELKHRRKKMQEFMLPEDKKHRPDNR